MHCGPRKVAAVIDTGHLRTKLLELTAAEALVIGPLTKATLVATTLAALFIPTSGQTQAIATAVGMSADGDAVFRIGYVHPWAGGWLERAFGFERLVEMTVAAWQTGPGGDFVHAVTLAPVWHRPIWGRLGLELMIGVGVFDNQQVGPHDMGSQAHFQTGVGLSYPVGHGFLTADVRHYSNAGLAKPNPGIEVYTIGYVFPF